MVKRYTSWDVVTDVGENIFVLEADYATLAEENRRLREALELVSAFFQKWPGVELLASERQARDKEAYHTLRAIARKALEVSDG
jgi:hypothetical protein